MLPSTRMSLAGKGVGRMFAVGKWRSALVLLALWILWFGVPTTANACGVDTDCEVGDRVYRILLPADDGAGDIGAIIFAHGFRGTAAGVLKDERLTGVASELGLAFVAAQAAGPEWNIPNIPTVDAREGVDELAYFDGLVDDLTARFHVDPARIFVAGFSSGGMMVWHLACYRGTSFAGFVPMSGTFWAPVPESCPTGPVNLVHYHGKDDPVVPLHGRPIKDAHQGDVYDAMAMFVREGDYRPLEESQPSGLDCSRWADDRQHVLELCLFAGEHTMQPENLARAVRLFLAD